MTQYFHDIISYVLLLVFDCIRRNRIWKTCLICNKSVEIIKCREKKFKYCSKQCLGRAILSSPIVQAKIRRRFGASNNKWKGGYRKHTSGYLWKLVGRDYFLEHRYVMEQHIGRKLTKREQVHHKNGIKTDNRLENLAIVDIAEHAKQHHREGLFKPMGWSRKYSNCQGCGTTQREHSGRGLCNACLKRFHKNK